MSSTTVLAFVQRTPPCAKIRGDGYGSNNNSTIFSSEESAALVGVAPVSQAPASEWKRAWKVHRRAIPFLHAFDRYKPPDSSLSLMCLWWKALAGNDPNSPVYDDMLVYDLLPRATRVLVGPKLRRFYPRLHHSNVEIRTAFLDQTVTKIVNRVRSEGSGDNDDDASSSLSSSLSLNEQTKVRLITLGAGYDVRSIKLRERGVIDSAVELDLPEVVQAKTAILGSKRVQRRRPSLTKDLWPDFHQVDLNELDQVESIMDSIFQQDKNNNDEDNVDASPFTIFLFEGVMIYLDEGVPKGLLRICRAVLDKYGAHGALCFADRLEDIPGGDIDIGKRELASLGWTVRDWQPKPGLARHMGSAIPGVIPPLAEELEQEANKESDVDGESTTEA